MLKTVVLLNIFVEPKAASEIEYSPELVFILNEWLCCDCQNKCCVVWRM